MEWAARYLDSEFGISLVLRISIYEVTLKTFFNKEDHFLQWKKELVINSHSFLAHFPFIFVKPRAVLEAAELMKPGFLQDSFLPPQSSS